MQNCSHGEAPIIKGDKYYVSQSPKTEIKNDSMKDILYVPDVGSLMYVHIYTRPDIVYTVSCFDFDVLLEFFIGKQPKS